MIQKENKKIRKMFLVTEYAALIAGWIFIRCKELVLNFLKCE